MASLTQWTWVWVNSRRQWRAGKPGVLQSMGLQSWIQLSNWRPTNKQKSLELSGSLSKRQQAIVQESMGPRRRSWKVSDGRCLMLLYIALQIPRVIYLSGIHGKVMVLKKNNIQKPQPNWEARMGKLSRTVRRAESNRKKKGFFPGKDPANEELWAVENWLSLSIFPSIKVSSFPGSVGTCTWLTMVIDPEL